MFKEPALETHTCDPGGDALRERRLEKRGTAAGTAGGRNFPLDPDVLATGCFLRQEITK